MRRGADDLAPTLRYHKYLHYHNGFPIMIGLAIPVHRRAYMGHMCGSALPSIIPLQYRYASIVLTFISLAVKTVGEF